MNYDIATNPEQSKRLLACGVPPKSADMYLSINLCKGDNYGKYSIHVFGNNNRTWRGVIMQHDYELAWSLSRLFDLLPSRLEDVLQTHWIDPAFWTSDEHVIDEYPERHLVNGDLAIRNNGDYWMIDYDWGGFMGRMAQGKTIIEAAVQMIELLHANGVRLNVYGE